VEPEGRRPAVTEAAEPETQRRPARPEVIELETLPEATVMMDPDPRNPAAAYENYATLIRDDPTREVAVYRNPVTGEYIVVQGVEGTVFVGRSATSGDPEAPHPAGSTQRWKEILGHDTGYWSLESHFHPDYADPGAHPALKRLPSGEGGDYDAVRYDSDAAGGIASTSRIHYLEGGEYRHTDFGYDPANARSPYWIEFDNPRTGARDRRRFRSLHEYEGWTGRLLRPDAPAAPMAPRTRTAPGAPRARAPPAESARAPRPRARAVGDDTSAPTGRRPPPLPADVQRLIDLPETSPMMPPDPKSRAQAIEMLRNSMLQDPHREVAVYINSETGEHVVIQGVRHEVFVEYDTSGNPLGPRGEGNPQRWKEILDSDRGDWLLVAHSHVGAADATPDGYRRLLPSARGGDFGVMMSESARLGGAERHSAIHVRQGDRISITEFGYDPSLSRPFAIIYDDPATNLRVFRRFKSLESYGEFFEGLTGVTPDIDRGTPAARTAELGSTRPGVGAEAERESGPRIAPSQRRLPAAPSARKPSGARATGAAADGAPETAAAARRRARAERRQELENDLRGHRAERDRYADQELRARRAASELRAASRAPKELRAWLREATSDPRWTAKASKDLLDPVDRRLEAAEHRLETIAEKQREAGLTEASRRYLEARYHAEELEATSAAAANKMRQTGDRIRAIEEDIDLLSRNPTAEEERARVIEEFGKPSGNTELEAALSGLSEYGRAYVRQYERAIAALEPYGIDPHHVVSGLSTASDSAFAQAFRHRLRRHGVDVLEQTRSRDISSVYANLMKAQPNNTSRGELFHAYREANMPPGYRTIKPGSSGTTIAGTSRRADGLLETTSGKPFPSGRYLAEDKSGYGAFDRAQAERYSRKMTDDGTVRTADGKSHRGVVYFFDDRSNAREAARYMNEKGLNASLRVAYFDPTTRQVERVR
jgi:hypothetical protein